MGQTNSWKVRARRRPLLGASHQNAPPANDNAGAPPVADDAEALHHDDAELVSIEAPQGGDPPPAAPDDEPPFDPPNIADMLGAHEFANDVDEPAAPAPAEITPTDPGELLLGAADEAPCEAPIAQPIMRERRAGKRPFERPVPPINIHVSWDRAEIADMLSGVATDPRVARAQISMLRGGIDGAIARYETQASPHLLILDTTLRGAELLKGLDRLAAIMQRGTKIIVIGAINDIALFRKLAARGIHDYIVPPMRRDDLLRAICRLFAQADQSRTIAVIGARGGVGASTIAHNLAWSIAERQELKTSLVDLDLAFGAASFNFRLAPSSAVADALLTPDHLDEAQFERAAARPNPRLQVLTAPSTLEQRFERDAYAFQAVINRVRRTSPYVVLDLPHLWTEWVRQALMNADEVLIVACPDLASLRNAANMLSFFKSARPNAPAPSVVFSMAGIAEDSAFAHKDFTQALGADPIATLDFDAELFGVCAIKGLMIGERAPNSKAALTLDALAATLTGRPPIDRSFSAPDAQSLDDAAISAPTAPEPQAPVTYTWDERLEPARTPAQLQLPFDAPAPKPIIDPFASEAEPVLQAEESAPSEEPYLAQAREAALVEFAAPLVAAKPRKGGRVFSRVAAAIIGFFTPVIVGGAWHLHNRDNDGANAAEPQAITSPHVTNIAPPSQDEWAGRYAFALDIIAAGRAEEGAMLLRRIADTGFAPAQYRLAKLYERGEGVELDLTQARQWTERAAAGGNSRAMHDLGVYFARGEGAPRDDAMAFQWFHEAAEFGIADSQYNLGLFYLKGRGVAADAGEALFWFNLAAAQGDDAAAEQIAELEAQASPMQTEQVRARIESFRPRAPNPSANLEP